MLTATKNANVDIDRDYRHNQSVYGKSFNSNDRFYDRAARDTTEEYRDHLYQSLSADRRVRASDDYEDEIRYNSINRDGSVNHREVTRTRDDQKTMAPVRRVFKKKLIPLVACYFLMVAVVITLIVVNVTGTAWEATTFTISPTTNILPQETANAITSPETGIVALNTIETSNGVVQISLSPYPINSTDKEDTNWFDQFCDWISNLVGG